MWRKYWTEAENFEEEYMWKDVSEVFYTSQIDDKSTGAVRLNLTDYDCIKIHNKKIDCFQW